MNAQTEMGASVSASPHCAELRSLRSCEFRTSHSGVASLPRSPCEVRGGSAALLGTMLSRSSLPCGFEHARRYRRFRRLSPIVRLRAEALMLANQPVISLRSTSSPAGGVSVRDLVSITSGNCHASASRTKRNLPPMTCGKRGYRGANQRRRSASQNSAASTLASANPPSKPITGSPSNPAPIAPPNGRIANRTPAERGLEDARGMERATCHALHSSASVSLWSRPR